MTLIIGHRGASANKKENTIEAFVAALEMGADWVELDVHQLQDGKIAVHHDAELADGTALNQIGAGDLPNDVPLLEDALEACGTMGVNIEIKNDPGSESFDPEHAMAPVVLEIAREMLGLDRCLISSFDMGAINAVRDLYSAMPTALLTDDDVGPDVSIGRAQAHSHKAINPADKLVTPRWMSLAQEAELDVYVWTVDDPDRMIELAELGVSGIVTNTVDVAVNALR